MKQDTKKFIAMFPGHHIFVTMREDSEGGPAHHHNGYVKSVELLKIRNDPKSDKWGHGIFFTVNEMDEELDPGRHRTGKMLVKCRAVFMDDDNPRDEPRTDFPLDPSLVVNSSPGKYHYYWLIDGGTDRREDWDLVQRALIVRYDGDKQAKDATRYLRLPGYYHNKSDPHMVKWSGEGHKYQWGELMEAYPPLEDSEVESASPEATGEEQSEVALENIIATAAPGLHGAINKVLWGMKKDNPNGKGRAIRFIQSLGKDVAGKDARTTNRFSYEELARSWDEAEADSDMSVPIVDRDMKTTGEMPWPPGAFGELASNAFDMARFQYREVAVISAIGLVAGVCGRKFNAEGAGLNIYATLIMDTGMGKDSIRKFINSALKNANDIGTGSSFIGPKRFTGPKSVYNSLESARSQICVFTEAGLLLNSKSGDGDGLKRVLLGIYTDSGENDWTGTEIYSDADKSVKDMRAPALSIINESTPEMLLSVFRKGDGLRSGDIPRQMIYRIIGEKPKSNRKHFAGKISEDCMSKIKHLVAKCSPVQAVDDPSAWHLIPDDLVEQDMEATEEYYRNMQNENRHSNVTKYAMATRAYYKAARLAAIASVFNHYKEEIHMEEWVWAKKMIAYEMEGLSMFFQGGGIADPISDITHRVVIPAVSRVLNDTVTIKSGLSKKEHKAGKFKHQEIAQVLKNNVEVNELSDQQGHRMISGIEKLIDYMTRVGLIFKLTTTRAVTYQVTDTFLAACED